MTELLLYSCAQEELYLIAYYITSQSHSVRYRNLTDADHRHR